MFYREKKQTKNIKNNYLEEIKGFNYPALVSELNSVIDRLLKDKVAWTKSGSQKFDRVKENSFEIDKWKKVQLLNLIQNKYNRRF